MGGEWTNQMDKNILSIYSIGDNSYGNITYLNKNDLNITKLFLSNYYQCFAIDTNNTLYSWGLNNYYQLANGKNCNYLFNNNKSESKDRNESNFCILAQESKNTISNTIKRLGNIFYSQIEFPIKVPKIREISCGDGFTLFLDDLGLVYSVGKNDKGQLGYELSNNESEFVGSVKCNPNLTCIDYFKDKMIKIKKIICGADFCLAIEEIDSNNINNNYEYDYNDDSEDSDDEGKNKKINVSISQEIYSWGNNEVHQLGIKENKYKYYFNPTKAIFLNKILNEKKTSVEKIVCGWSHGCFLTKNGGIYIWGNPFIEYNKKFKDIEKKININNLKNSSKILDISSGFNHMAILSSPTDNQSYPELFTFGANEFGQLGYETDEIYIEHFNKVIIPKSDINENLSINKVECGAYHTIIQMGGNLIYGFGQNNCQQLGKYKEDYLISPKKWNHPFETFFKNDLKTDEKVLSGIRCGNGITCLLFKNKTQLEEKEENNQQKKYYNLSINQEHLPLKCNY